MRRPRLIAVNPDARWTVGKVRDRQRARRERLALKLRNLFWDSAGYKLSVREEWGEGNWMERGPRVNGWGGTPENNRRAWLRMACEVRRMCSRAHGDGRFDEQERRRQEIASGDLKQAIFNAVEAQNGTLLLDSDLNAIVEVFIHGAKP